MKESKARLRQEISARLKQTDPLALKQAGELICARLKALPLFCQAKLVLAYAPMPTELDLWPLLGQLAQAGRLALPLMIGPGRMEARQISDLRALERNSYGIAEPPPASPLLEPQQLELILVPGLAFSRDLARLGRGGGYYDRYLTGCPAFRLALAWQMQVVDELPCEEHDMRMDAILTEVGYIG